MSDILRKYLIPSGSEIHINGVPLLANKDIVIIFPRDIMNLIEEVRGKSLILTEPKLISSDFQWIVISVNPLELISVH